MRAQDYVVTVNEGRIALLSQEGSVIAFFAMTRGVVPKRTVSECILKSTALEPPPA